MLMAIALPLGSPTFLLLAKATNLGFLFLEEKESASPLLKRETRGWQLNRAVGERLPNKHKALSSNPTTPKKQSSGQNSL
jgi:hypothetical protein